MNIGSMKIGEEVYALVSKFYFTPDGIHEKDEVFVMPGVIVGLSFDSGVTIRNDDFTFQVHEAFIFKDQKDADAAAEMYNNTREHCDPDEQEFTVCVRVTGRALVTVRAKDAESARCKANGKVCDMDFGELEDIDWDGVYAEDEHCNRTDF